MGVGNIAVNNWISNKERFADLFNSTVFRGKRFVKPEELAVIESESSILVTDKEQKTKGTQRYRDVVMRWRGKVDLAILACESQDKVHYAMPIRNMLYDSLSYTEQTKILWEEHQKEERKPTDEEYLSRFYKDDKIIPVITIVFYYGNKKWDGHINLYEMFDVNNELIKEVLENYVPNYWINLIDAGNTEIEYSFQTDLQKIFPVLKYRKSKRKLLDYIRKHEEYFRNVDIDTYYALKTFLKSSKVITKEVAISNREEMIDMCEALEELYQDGVNEGIEKGIIVLVDFARELGQKKEDVISRIMDRFNMEQSAACLMVEKYW